MIDPHRPTPAWALLLRTPRGLAELYGDVSRKLRYHPIPEAEMGEEGHDGVVVGRIEAEPGLACPLDSRAQPLDDLLGLGLGLFAGRPPPEAQVTTVITM